MLSCPFGYLFNQHNVRDSTFGMRNWPSNYQIHMDITEKIR